MIAAHGLTANTINPLLAQLQERSTGSTVPCDVIFRLLTEISQAYGADYARIMLSVGQSNPSTLICCYADGQISPIREGHWIEERTLTQRAPIVVSSTTPLPYFCDYLTNKPRVTELLSVPIFQQENIIGTVSLGYISARTVAREELDSLTSFCNIFANYLPSDASSLTLGVRYTVDLSVLYAQMPWAVMLVDDDGLVLSVNSTCSKMLQRDADAVYGLSLNDLLVEAPGGVPHISGEVAYLLRPDTSKFLVKITRTTITIDDGHIITMLVFWDVSQEQQLLEERLRNAELEGISHTVATVNHEINNPLFGLMATVQLLRSELQPAQPSVEKKFQRIGECCERIQLIVDKLSHVMQPARRTYAANEGMLDLSRAMGQFGIKSASSENTADISD